MGRGDIGKRTCDREPAVSTNIFRIPERLTAIGVAERGVIGMFSPNLGEAPAPLPVGVSIPLEQSRGSGHVSARDCGARDRHSDALRRTDRKEGR